jgi:flavin prenyltransferase
MKKRLVIGITGASGANLAIHLLQAIRNQGGCESHLICSEASRRTIEYETIYSFAQVSAKADVFHDIQDIEASIASGTFKTEGMVVIPCSMKTLAGIAHGYASNLLTRAADVTLKERRKLLLLVRETPLNLIHLQNMVTLASIGVVIMPPVLTYYNHPKTLHDMEIHIVGKVMREFGMEMEGFQSWEG